MTEQDEHFERLSRWLEMESEAETQRLAERRRRMNRSDAERTGETLLDLVVADHQPTLGGRFLLTLVKRNRKRELPWHRLKAGAPVVLTPEDEEGASTSGVVSARSTQAIQVVVDRWPDANRFRIDLSSDEVTRRRQKTALARVREARGRVAELRKVLMNIRSPAFGNTVDCVFTTKLNSTQEEAVRFALSAEDLAIIHGPPGTGKTTTVVEFILQALARDQKILACAPSNTAVDNMLERLVALSVPCVRIGHPARVMSDLRDHTLDGQVASHENMKWAKGLLREAEELFRDADRYTRAKPVKGYRAETRRQAKQLKSQARMLERQAVEHVLNQAVVILSTTTIDEELLGDRWFDWAVIDEACQSTEPGCWIPVLRADRILFAGDHCQLPPTIISTEAAREGFNVSMMERLVASYGDVVTHRLGVQYRMHERIMQFSSQEFYESSLTADNTVATHVLADIDGVANNELTSCPVTFIDTAGADYDEEREPDGESRRNPQEADVAMNKAQALVEAGVPPNDIAMIAPYAAQVRLLRQLRDERGLDRTMEIDTVDGFQGREKESVIITLVRSNKTGEIGFLADARRMNVAMTRARRKLIVIGDSATIGSNEFYVRMLEYFESIAAYHSVWEYL
jgi:ATP-dependent RNA/DNA helicase IGHMBP2